MSSYNYTIIIPHKNIPNLLQRCLSSIPEREDVQVIIVDDNSDPSKVDFTNFPGSKRANTEVYFTKEGKGAGYARNVGLKHAKGKWLIFADADDFFTKEINSILDKYKNVEADIIFFNAESADSETLEVSNRNLHLNSLIQNNDIQGLKYSFFPPWCKCIKTELQTKNNIMFSETPAANDALFSVYCGWHSQKTIIESIKGYCVTYRSNSLETSQSLPNRMARIYISLEVNKFYKSHTINRECNFFYRHLTKLLFINIRKFFQALHLCHQYGYSYPYLTKKIFSRIFLQIIKRISQ